MTTNSTSDPSGRFESDFPASAANDDMLFEDVRPRSPAEALEPARAPEPPEYSRRRKTHPLLAVLNGLMTLLVVGLLGFGGLIYFAKIEFDNPGPLDHSTVVVIPKGEGVNAIAERLEREGVISDRRIFVASVMYFKAQNKLKAGEYEVRKNASMRDVLDQLVRGKSILYKVSIPEGFTSQQVVARLNGASFLEGEITEIPAEGTLMPDTYKFSRGMTRADMLERMRAEQRKFIANLWDSRAGDLPFKTPQEAIILASIVEKETGRADERTRVAGVFVNRLRKNMRLQSDPTVIYGLVGGKGSLGRGILRTELQKETPYNTYIIAGLPPGPIANPGRAAIEAVLNPAVTTDLYFVANGTGGHAFAPTLAAHNRNVARWREIERQMREKREAEAKAKAEAEALGKVQGQAPVATAQPGAVPQGLPPGTPGVPAIGGVPGLSVGGPLVGLQNLNLQQLGTSTLAMPQALPVTPPDATPTTQPATVAAGAGNTGPSVPLPVRNPRPR